MQLCIPPYVSNRSILNKNMYDLGNKILKKIRIENCTNQEQILLNIAKYFEFVRNVCRCSKHLMVTNGLRIFYVKFFFVWSRKQDYLFERHFIFFVVLCTRNYLKCLCLGRLGSNH